MEQGFPDTIEKLKATVENSLSAAYLGAAWAAWISQGVERNYCPTEEILLEGWNPAIFADDHIDDRQNYKKNLYQFLLRGLLRDCANDVEHFAEVTNALPRNGRGNLIWSEAADPIYVLRVLRNAFNHTGWTIGNVHRDVSWNELSFRRNVGDTEVPAGFRKTDPIIERFPREPGAIILVSSLMVDVIECLGSLPTPK